MLSSKMLHFMSDFPNSEFLLQMHLVFRKQNIVKEIRNSELEKSNTKCNTSFWNFIWVGSDKYIYFRLEKFTQPKSVSPLKDSMNLLRNPWTRFMNFTRINPWRLMAKNKCLRRTWNPWTNKLRLSNRR